MLPSVGVFGTDEHAQVLIRLFKSNSFEVTTVCGKTSLEDVRRTAEEHGIETYTRKTQELLLNSNVGLVCVTGDPHECAEVAVKALSIGKHVFTMSPCGVKTKEANRMLTASQYYPMLLSLVNHPLRFLPAFGKARDLIKSKHIGDVFLCECTVHTGSLIGQKYDWRCDVATGGGILQTYGSHVIDILTFLLDEKAGEVQGLVETFITHKESFPKFRQLTSDDFCSFQLKYENNLRACVTLNSNMPSGFIQNITLIGTKGNLKIINKNLYLQMNNSTKVEELVIEEPSQEKDETSRLSENTAIPDMFSCAMEYLINGIKRAFQSVGQTADYFIEFLEDKRLIDHDLIEEAANFKNGCYTRCILDAILQSSKERRWVAVKDTSMEEEGFGDMTADEGKMFWDIRETLLRESAPNTPQNTAALPRKSHITNLRRIISQPAIYKREADEEIAIHDSAHSLDVGRFRKITEGSEKSLQPSRKITEIAEKSPRPSRRITEVPEKSPKPSRKLTSTPEKSPKPSRKLAATPEKSPRPSRKVTDQNDRFEAFNSTNGFL